MSTRYTRGNDPARRLEAVWLNVEPVFVHTFLFDLHPASRRVPGLHNNKVQSDSRALKIDFCCPRLVPGGAKLRGGNLVVTW